MAHSAATPEDDRLTLILKRVRRIELITRGLIKENLGGAYHSRFKGQGIEFDDFREYQPGDDVRFLDWNVTARMNSPFVRKYIEERELTVFLLVDISGSGDYGSAEDTKRERAAELAAVFGFSAAHNGDKVGLCLFGAEVEHYVPARKGASHVMRLLRDILTLQPGMSGTDPTEALRLATQRISHRALVVVCSDFLIQDGAWEKALKTAAAKHDVVAVRFTDPAERELPAVGRVLVQDPESGRQLLLNTSNPKLRRQYRERLEKHDAALLERFNQYGVESISVSLDQDYVPSLVAYFRARRRRRR